MPCHLKTTKKYAVSFQRAVCTHQRESDHSHGLGYRHRALQNNGQLRHDHRFVHGVVPGRRLQKDNEEDHMASAADDRTPADRRSADRLRLPHHDLKDFATPVTEFREAALADANVRELKRGGIIQFERRGYYIFDGIAEKGKQRQEKTWEFIRIPDGRAAGLASKAGGTAAAEAPRQSKGEDSAGKPAKPNDKKGKIKTTADDAAPAAGGVDKYGVTPPPDTKMYKVDMVVGSDALDIENATKMYKVESVYQV